MRKLVVAIIMTSLVGCATSTGHRVPVEVKDTLNEAINEANSRGLEQLPASVEADLMPELIEANRTVVDKVKRFRVKAKDVPANAFFASLVNGTEYSVAIHPEVTGSISANLTDVSLEEVLNVVRDIYGYDIARSGNIIRVHPAGLRTVTIPVDYLQLKRNGRSVTSISTGTIANSDSSSDSSGNSGGTEIETTSESDFWSQLKETVSSLIGSGEGKSVLVTPQAGVITVRAFPDEIRQVREFLGMSQQRMQRQVILETKILEVTLSDGYQQGIDWSKAFSVNGTNVTASRGNPNDPKSIVFDPIGTALGGVSNLIINGGSFDSVLSFMATQGDLNVLSSPRVTTSNNQKAVIKVGTDEYFVTDLSTSTSGSGDDAQINPDLNIEPFFSGISLDVTPQIDDEGNVLLHVHPAVIDVSEQEKQIGFLGGTVNLPLASSSIRESDSVIRARDGDVVVIGGLMKTSVKEEFSKVPLLGDVPVVGHLFRNTSKLTQKTELVILLKPTVVGVNTWQKELERSQQLLQEWFPDEL